MFEDIFIERILETENLTDNLEDAEANRLLDWGISKIAGLILDIEDRDLAGEKVNALMALMRKINRILGVLPDKPVEELASDLASLIELHNSTFGSLRPIMPEECQTAAANLANLPVGLALEFLMSWLLTGPNQQPS